MFTTQLSRIESQRSSILAQIEELTRQEQALVQESLHYQEMDDEATSLLNAITSLKNKFSNHENATCVLFAKISKIFQNLPTESKEESKSSENETTLDGKTAVDDPPIIDAIETAVNRYESATEIAAALADEENLDVNLMAIANVLDSCPQEEIAGRVWFFVQNIPGEFDDRILGYLPKSIRPEWDKQRTALEEEAKASNSTTSEEWVNLVNDEEEDIEVLGGDLDDEEETSSVSTQTNIFDAIEVVEKAVKVEPTFQPDDLVQLPDGRVCRVQSTAQAGTANLVTVIFADKSLGNYHSNILTYFGKFQAPVANPFKKGDWVCNHQGEVLEVLRIADIDGHQYVEVEESGKQVAYKPTDLKPATKPETSSTKTKTKKAKTTTATGADILKCTTWLEIRAIAKNNPQLLKDAGLAAKSKAEKALIEQLPEMIYQYIVDNKDSSDIDWMPKFLSQRVQMFLNSKTGSAA